MCLEPSHSQGNLSDKSSTPHTEVDLNFQSKYSARFTKLSSFLFNKENSLSDFYSAIRICFIKTVDSDQLGEIFRGLFLYSFSAGVGHVDVVQTKLLCVSVSPLEVIQQRPSKVTLDRDRVQLDRFQDLVGVVLVVVNSQEVIKIAELGFN